MVVKIVVSVDFESRFGVIRVAPPLPAAFSRIDNFAVLQFWIDVMGFSYLRSDVLEAFFEDVGQFKCGFAFSESGVLGVEAVRIS